MILPDQLAAAAVAVDLSAPSLSSSFVVVAEVGSRMDPVALDSSTDTYSRAPMTLLPSKLKYQPLLPNGSAIQLRFSDLLMSNSALQNLLEKECWFCW